MLKQKQGKRSGGKHRTNLENVTVTGWETIRATGCEKNKESNKTGKAWGRAI